MKSGASGWFWRGIELGWEDGQQNYTWAVFDFFFEFFFVLWEILFPNLYVQQYTYAY